MQSETIHNFGDLAFTPSVRAVQQKAGSRAAQARMEGVEHNVVLPADLLEFIATRDSFYLATVGENGWPYVQHRGGAPGFLRHLDENLLGVADLRGNRQYISTGNLEANGRACVFLMDYPNRFRLKLWVKASVTQDAALLARLTLPGVPPTAVERGYLLRVLAFDRNCSAHIVPRYTRAEVEAATAPMRARIAELEARLSVSPDGKINPSTPGRQNP